MKINSKFRKVVAVLTVLCLASTSIFIPSVRAELPAQPVSIIQPTSIKQINLPVKFGEVVESYAGNGTVIVIQDAHAIPDAQKNIANMIKYFRSEYGVSTVSLEGASGDLDPQIFKSFPDQKLLKEVMKGYLDAGEIAGGTAAAVFDKKPQDYKGVEDWGLYEEALGFYLKAVEKESELLQKLNAERLTLNAEKEKAYSKEMLAVDQAVEKFYENSSQLTDLIKILGAVKAPAPGSELEAVWKEIQKTSDQRLKTNDKDAEVREVSNRVEKFFKGQTAKQFTSHYSQFTAMKQEWMTGSVTAEAFAMYLKETAEKYDIQIEMSGELLGMVREQRKLKELEGTKFFRDLEAYIREVKDMMISHTTSEVSTLDVEEVRGLDRRTQELRMLTKLVKLELSRAEWNQFKTTYQRLQTTGDKTLQSSVFSPQSFIYHMAFYTSAEERDEVFFKNLTSREPRATGHETQIIVAGGFHAEGITNHLKEAGMGYVLVMPKIGHIPENMTYRAQMHGEVSWKEYFEVENGRIHLYKAFVRATRDRLLASSGQGSADRKNLTLNAESLSLLKAWRDQIIRDLSDTGKVERAAWYTRYMDEVIDESLKHTDADKLMSKVDSFINGLRGLEKNNQIDQAHIAQLLKANMIPSATMTTGADPNTSLSVAIVLGDAGKVDVQVSSSFTFSSGAETPVLPSVPSVVFPTDSTRPEARRSESRTMTLREIEFKLRKITNELNGLRRTQSAPSRGGRGNQGQIKSQIAGLEKQLRKFEELRDAANAAVAKKSPSALTVTKETPKDGTVDQAIIAAKTTYENLMVRVRQVNLPGAELEALPGEARANSPRDLFGLYRTSAERLINAAAEVLNAPEGTVDSVARGQAVELLALSRELVTTALTFPADEVGVAEMKPELEALYAAFLPPQVSQFKQAESANNAAKPEKSMADLEKQKTIQFKLIDKRTWFEKLFGVKISFLPFIIVKMSGNKTKPIQNTANSTQRNEDNIWDGTSGSAALKRLTFVAMLGLVWVAFIFYQLHKPLPDDKAPPVAEYIAHTDPLPYWTDFPIYFRAKNISSPEFIDELKKNPSLTEHILKLGKEHVDQLTEWDQALIDAARKAKEQASSDESLPLDVVQMFELEVKSNLATNGNNIADAIQSLSDNPAYKTILKLLADNDDQILTLLDPVLGLRIRDHLNGADSLAKDSDQMPSAKKQVPSSGSTGGNDSQINQDIEKIIESALKANGDNVRRALESLPNQSAINDALNQIEKGEIPAGINPKLAEKVKRELEGKKLDEKEAVESAVTQAQGDIKKAIESLKESNPKLVDQLAQKDPSDPSLSSSEKAISQALNESAAKSGAETRATPLATPQFGGGKVFSDADGGKPSPLTPGTLSVPELKRLADGSLAMSNSDVQYVAKITGASQDGDFWVTAVYNQIKKGQFTVEGDASVHHKGTAVGQPLTVKVKISNVQVGTRIQLPVLLRGMTIKKGSPLDAIQIDENGVATINSTVTDTIEFEYRVQRFSGFSGKGVTTADPDLAKNVPAAIAKKFENFGSKTIKEKKKILEDVVHEFFSYNMASGIKLLPGETWMGKLAAYAASGQKFPIDCDVIAEFVQMFLNIYDPSAEVLAIVGYSNGGDLNTLTANEGHGTVVVRFLGGDWEKLEPTEWMDQDKNADAWKLTKESSDKSLTQAAEQLAKEMDPQGTASPEKITETAKKIKRLMEKLMAESNGEPLNISLGDLSALLAMADLKGEKMSEEEELDSLARQLARQRGKSLSERVGKALGLDAVKQLPSFQDMPQSEKERTELELGFMQQFEGMSPIEILQAVEKSLSGQSNAAQHPYFLAALKVLTQFQEEGREEMNDSSVRQLLKEMFMKYGPHGRFFTSNEELSRLVALLVVDGNIEYFLTDPEFMVSVISSLTRIREDSNSDENLRGTESTPDAWREWLEENLQLGGQAMVDYLTSRSYYSTTSKAADWLIKYFPEYHETAKFLMEHQDWKRVHELDPGLYGEDGVFVQTAQAAANLAQQVLEGKASLEDWITFTNNNKTLLLDSQYGNTSFLSRILYDLPPGSLQGMDVKIIKSLSGKVAGSFSWRNLRWTEEISKVLPYDSEHNPGGFWDLSEGKQKVLREKMLGEAAYAVRTITQDDSYLVQIDTGLATLKSLARSKLTAHEAEYILGNTVLTPNDNPAGAEARGKINKLILQGQRFVDAQNTISYLSHRIPLGPESLDAGAGRLSTYYLLAARDSLSRRLHRLSDEGMSSIMEAIERALKAKGISGEVAPQRTGSKGAMSSDEMEKMNKDDPYFIGRIQRVVGQELEAKANVQGLAFLKEDSFRLNGIHRKQLLESADTKYALSEIIDQLSLEGVSLGRLTYQTPANASKVGLMISAGKLLPEKFDRSWNKRVFFSSDVTEPQLFSGLRVVVVPVGVSSEQLADSVFKVSAIGFGNADITQSVKRALEELKFKQAPIQAASPLDGIVRIWVEKNTTGWAKALADGDEEFLRKFLGTSADWSYLAEGIKAEIDGGLNKADEALVRKIAESVPGMQTASSKARPEARLPAASQAENGSRSEARANVDSIGNDAGDFLRRLRLQLELPPVGGLAEVERWWTREFLRPDNRDLGSLRIRESGRISDGLRTFSDPGKVRTVDSAEEKLADEFLGGADGVKSGREVRDVFNRLKSQLQKLEIVPGNQTKGITAVSQTVLMHALVLAQDAVREKKTGAKDLARRVTELKALYDYYQGKEKHYSQFNSSVGTEAEAQNRQDEPGFMKVIDGVKYIWSKMLQSRLGLDAPIEYTFEPTHSPQVAEAQINLLYKLGLLREQSNVKEEEADSLHINTMFPKAAKSLHTAEKALKIIMLSGAVQYATPQRVDSAAGFWNWLARKVDNIIHFKENVKDEDRIEYRIFDPKNPGAIRFIQLMHGALKNTVYTVARLQEFPDKAEVSPVELELAIQIERLIAVFDTPANAQAANRDVEKLLSKDFFDYSTNDMVEPLKRLQANLDIKTQIEEIMGKVQKLVEELNESNLKRSEDGVEKFKNIPLVKTLLKEMNATPKVAEEVSRFQLIERSLPPDFISFDEISRASIRADVERFVPFRTNNYKDLFRDIEMPKVDYSRYWYLPSAPTIKMFDFNVKVGSVFKLDLRTRLLFFLINLGLPLMSAIRIAFFVIQFPGWLIQKIMNFLRFAPPQILFRDAGKKVYQLGSSDQVEFPDGRKVQLNLTPDGHLSVSDEQGEIGSAQIPNNGTVVVGRDEQEENSVVSEKHLVLRRTDKKISSLWGLLSRTQIRVIMVDRSRNGVQVIRNRVRPMVKKANILLISLIMLVGSIATNFGDAEIRGDRSNVPKAQANAWIATQNLYVGISEMSREAREFKIGQSPESSEVTFLDLFQSVKEALPYFEEYAKDSPLNAKKDVEGAMALLRAIANYESNGGDAQKKLIELIRLAETNQKVGAFLYSANMSAGQLSVRSELRGINEEKKNAIGTLAGLGVAAVSIVLLGLGLVSSLGGGILLAGGVMVAAFFAIQTQRVKNENAVLETLSGRQTLEERFQSPLSRISNEKIIEDGFKVGDVFGYKQTASGEVAFWVIRDVFPELSENRGKSELIFADRYVLTVDGWRKRSDSGASFYGATPEQRQHFFDGLGLLGGQLISRPGKPGQVYRRANNLITQAFGKDISAVISAGENAQLRVGLLSRFVPIRSEARTVKEVMDELSPLAASLPSGITEAELQSMTPEQMADRSLISELQELIKAGDRENNVYYLAEILAFADLYKSALERNGKYQALAIKLDAIDKEVSDEGKRNPIFIQVMQQRLHAYTIFHNHLERLSGNRLTQGKADDFIKSVIGGINAPIKQAEAWRHFRRFETARSDRDNAFKLIQNTVTALFEIGIKSSPIVKQRLDATQYGLANFAQNVSISAGVFGIDNETGEILPYVADEHARGTGARKELLDDFVGDFNRAADREMGFAKVNDPMVKTALAVVWANIVNNNSRVVRSETRANVVWHDWRVDKKGKPIPNAAPMSEPVALSVGDVIYFEKPRSKPHLLDDGYYYQVGRDGNDFTFYRYEQAAGSPVAKLVSEKIKIPLSQKEPEGAFNSDRTANGGRYVFNFEVKDGVLNVSVGQKYGVLESKPREDPNVARQRTMNWLSKFQSNAKEKISGVLVRATVNDKLSDWSFELNRNLSILLRALGKLFMLETDNRFRKTSGMAVAALQTAAEAYLAHQARLNALINYADMNEIVAVSVLDEMRGEIVLERDFREKANNLLIVVGSYDENFSTDQFRSRQVSYEDELAGLWKDFDEPPQEWLDSSSTYDEALKKTQTVFEIFRRQMQFISEVAEEILERDSAEQRVESALESTRRNREQNWRKTDFYAALGVSADADERAIRKAYFRIAKKDHGDVVESEPTAESKTRMQEAVDAYEVLGDPILRAQYDRISPFGRSEARITIAGMVEAAKQRLAEDTQTQEFTVWGNPESGVSIATINSTRMTLLSGHKLNRAEWEQGIKSDKIGLNGNMYYYLPAPILRLELRAEKRNQPSMVTPAVQPNAAAVVSRTAVSPEQVAKNTMRTMNWARRILNMILGGRQTSDAAVREVAQETVIEIQISGSVQAVEGFLIAAALAVGPSLGESKSLTATQSIDAADAAQFYISLAAVIKNQAKLSDASTGKVDATFGIKLPKGKGSDSSVDRAGLERVLKRILPMAEDFGISSIAVSGNGMQNLVGDIIRAQPSLQASGMRPIELESAVRVSDARIATVMHGLVDDISAKLLPVDLSMEDLGSDPILREAAMMLQFTVVLLLARNLAGRNSTDQLELADIKKQLLVELKVAGITDEVIQLNNNRFSINTSALKAVFADIQAKQAAAVAA